MVRDDLAQAVLQYARRRPELGQFTVSKALAKKGLNISPSGVRTIWKKHALETAYLRLTAKAKTSASAGKSLSPTQVATLRRERVSKRLKTRAELEAESPTDLRREELLQAGEKLFAKKGYQHTSLREICSIAGIRPTSFYYHFRSKEDLFATVHRIGMQRMNSVLDRAVDDVTEPWEKLEVMCALAMRYVLDDTDIAAVVRAASFEHFRPKLQRELKADRAAYEARFQNVIDQLSFPPRFDRSLFKLALLGAMNWANNWYRPGRLTPEELGRNLVRDIFNVGRRPSGLAHGEQVTRTTRES
jgi:AcrR family transcriptional regulator